MKQKSIAITAVLAATMLTAVFVTAQLAYADSSDTDINIKEKKEVDINGDGNTVLQCSENNLNSEIDANTLAQCSNLPGE
jgi:hypothetical protein